MTLEGKRVKVTTRDHGVFEGTLLEDTPEALVLHCSGRIEGVDIHYQQTLRRSIVTDVEALP